MSRHPGIFNALTAAQLFGASTPLAKLALSSANPLLVSGLLYLGSSVGLAILADTATTLVVIANALRLPRPSSIGGA